MKKFPLILSFSFFVSGVMAQTDSLLLSEPTVYTYATFKTTRLINGHSVENVGAGVLDFKIQHRFGFINTGIGELFGLDNATTRLGFDYGISKRLMVGIGRSSFEKQLDGFYKFKVLRQSTGAVTMPVSLSILSSVIVKTAKWPDPARKNYFSSRLYYAHQVIVARKFSEVFSWQIMPTYVHHNLVRYAGDPNNLFAVGTGARLKISKRMSINGEYYYQLPDSKLTGSKNSIAMGVDIETGGHVFQLQFTNSTGMTEKTFINETTGDFFDGDIHFGFNIARVFTLKDKRKKIRKD